MYSNSLAFLLRALQPKAFLGDSPIILTTEENLPFDKHFFLRHVLLEYLKNFWANFKG